MKNLAIITARSGSKGLKDKNIMMINGKPLIAYSIEAAVRSLEFCEVMVSTDSEEYAMIAKEYGASVPFLRSDKNASDQSNKWDVVYEVLKEYESRGVSFDTFCVLQPTSPLRTFQDINNAYRLFLEKDAISVVSVCKAESSPLWMNTLGEDGSMDGFLNEETDLLRQELPVFYRLNGAIYLMRVDAFYENRNPYRKGCFAYEMPISKSVDIDSIFDFKFAEFCMREGGAFENEV